MMFDGLVAVSLSLGSNDIIQDMCCNAEITEVGERKLLVWRLRVPIRERQDIKIQQNERTLVSSSSRVKGAKSLRERSQIARQ
jgi:hypothetical protein